MGLAWDERVADYRAHQQGKIVASPTYADVAKPVYSSSVGRWRRYERQLEPVRHVLDPIAAALGYE